MVYKKILSFLLFLSIVSSLNSMETPPRRVSEELNHFDYRVACAVAIQQDKMDQRVAQADAQSAAAIREHGRPGKPRKSDNLCVLY